MIQLLANPGAAGGSDISMHIFEAERINYQSEHLETRFNSSESRDNKKISRHAQIIFTFE